MVTSGMGVRRAAEATRSLVEQYHPSVIITFGIAGAVENELEVGDVVLPEAYCRLEGQLPGEIRPLARWPGEVREAARQAIGGLNKRLYLGTAITTNGSQVSQAQLAGLPHPVLEMETAGIARVASENDIPVRSLRAISDGPDAPIPLDLGQVMDEDANLKVGKMLGVLLRNPKILGQSMRMMRNSALAEKHAAVTLIAAIYAFN